MVKINKKYAHILEAAQSLFWKHGFKRVSIEEVCQNAGVSKMTFYKHFPNKIELAKTIFDNVVVKGEIEFRSIMKSDLSPAEKINKVLLLKLESTNDISPEFMQDFYAGGEPELKAYVEQRTRKAWDVLRSDYLQAQKEGVFRNDLNIDFLIKVQFKLIELINDESVTSMFENRQQLIMEFARLLVYGIIPATNEKES